MIAEKQLMKLQNGSDVRGVAIAGVADEPVNLTEEAANRIAAGFLHFLEEKSGKKAHELKIAVGHDSRISAESLKSAILAALLARGAEALDCGLASTPAMFMSILFDETKAWKMPVVDDEGRYLGFISKSAIFNSYREVLNGTFIGD